jgi:demethylmenaquinone methyltransferase/2-methoxy-6-polyprenyl-1,4-benzoquinol methylase
VLPAYYSGEQDRRGFVREIFDNTAADYEPVERLLSFGTGARYRRDALRRAGVAPGMRVLDVATGTGLVAREAAALVGNDGAVYGVDPSWGMLQNAPRPGRTALIQGTAEKLPFANGEFDFVTVGFALRHLADLEGVFAEFHRVLRPSGVVCLLEITLPERAWLRNLLKLYMRRIAPLASRLVARQADTPTLCRYYWDTIEACVAPAEVIASLQRVGFLRPHHHIEARCFSEYTAQR